MIRRMSKNQPKLELFHCCTATTLMDPVEFAAKAFLAPMSPSEVFRQLLETHGTGGHESAAEVLEYISTMIDDEDFEYGRNGEEAFEAIGPFLVLQSCGGHGHLPTVCFRSIPYPR